MRLKDLAVGKEYILGERLNRYYRDYTPVTVLSTSLHRWLFSPVKEREDGNVTMLVAGQSYNVPEEMTVLRSGGTKGALVTWVQSGCRFFTVVSASKILMTVHDYELVMAKDIAEENRRVAEARQEAKAASLVRAKEVAKFNAVFGRRLAGRPNELSPRNLNAYIDNGYYTATTQLAMKAALWGAGSKKRKP